MRSSRQHGARTERQILQSKGGAIKTLTEMLHMMSLICRFGSSLFPVFEIKCGFSARSLCHGITWRASFVLSKKGRERSDTRTCKGNKTNCPPIKPMFLTSTLREPVTNVLHFPYYKTNICFNVYLTGVAISIHPSIHPHQGFFFSCLFR